MGWEAVYFAAVGMIYMMKSKYEQAVTHDRLRRLDGEAASIDQVTAYMSALSSTIGERSN